MLSCVLEFHLIGLQFWQEPFSSEALGGETESELELWQVRQLALGIIETKSK
jgi:hypothetical protein